MTKLKENFR